MDKQEENKMDEIGVDQGFLLSLNSVYEYIHFNHT